MLHLDQINSNVCVGNFSTEYQVVQPCEFIKYEVYFPPVMSFLECCAVMTTVYNTGPASPSPPPLLPRLGMDTNLHFPWSMILNIEAITSEPRRVLTRI